MNDEQNTFQYFALLIIFVGCAAFGFWQGFFRKNDDGD
jgi:hypothetical protein